MTFTLCPVLLEVNQVFAPTGIFRDEIGCEIRDFDLKILHQTSGRTWEEAKQKAQVWCRRYAERCRRYAELPQPEKIIINPAPNTGANYTHKT